MPAPCREARVRVLQRLATVVDRPPLLEASWLHERHDAAMEKRCRPLA